MYQAPEVEHLQKAVDAVKRGLLPEKQKTPSPGVDRQLALADEHDEEKPE